MSPSLHLLHVLLLSLPHPLPDWREERSSGYCAGGSQPHTGKRQICGDGFVGQGFIVSEGDGLQPVQPGKAQLPRPLVDAPLSSVLHIGVTKCISPEPGGSQPSAGGKWPHPPLTQPHPLHREPAGRGQATQGSHRHIWCQPSPKN